MRRGKPVLYCSLQVSLKYFFQTVLGGNFLLGNITVKIVDKVIGG
jgi:hypothetical protein